MGLPPINVGHPVGGDEDEAGGEEGGAGDQTTGSRLLPVFTARIRAAAAELQQTVVSDQAWIAAEEVEPVEVGRTTLPNGYQIAFYDSFCVLYDEEGAWVGEFPTEEEAIAEAFRRRSPPVQPDGPRR